MNILINKDELKEYMKEYRIKNKDNIKEYSKKYYIKNKDKMKEYRIKNKDKMKEYRLNNRDKFKEYSKKYYAKNRENIRENMRDKFKEYRRQYYINNLVKQKEYSRDYKTKNPDVVKIQKFKKRMKLKKITCFDLTKTTLQKIRLRDNKTCVYCGNEGNSYDHIIPISHKGEFPSSNSIINLVMSCMDCNQNKSSKNVFKWCYENNKEVPKIIIELLHKQISQRFFININRNN